MNIDSISASPSAVPTPCSFRVLTDEERNASLRQSLEEVQWCEKQDLWVYGYGSLIWRPDFEFAEQRQALLRGYHRALCLWSRINRGTPEQPGLVFGLDVGGSCRGMAFRIPAESVPKVFDALWLREMPSGAYIPRWLRCRTSQGDIRALVFTMNRKTDAYVPRMPDEQLRQVVYSAQGTNGPCIEYVMETASALQRSKILDKRLQSVVQLLQSHTALLNPQQA
ncbi:gamma-glutamylcyclotransferase [Alcaligenes ammonioxydans]|uniref:glutathione-specific gamma-glutamylcyclotransferase n=1 Tax=Alcaligenes ammonioxydans TaxID=2582914 RepID=A0ABX8SQ68_9BURK|nr:gamma-glutamylcyclotransferase [Alcaligenes ammonioxydans]EJC61705.1 multidrug efflux-associated protein [Alcaligenes faecalis subsp. faecalis NCIB 8687]QBH20136.1 gamma-glutamylcyclotransferase [Alcaligenes faecalis]HRL22451.1 gamma-glutamylcyclotransferase [Alcaligenes sp.]MCH1879337.1 gamma-glutamylcyclotransferase [Alcaligenes ammonioxydans]QXX78172.1 gamma-glutamylcyclotransferase [Alcaligenes ammonioxydans]